MAKAELDQTLAASFKDLESKNRLLALNHQIEESEARLKYARFQTSQLEVKSPIEGQVMISDVEQ